MNKLTCMALSMLAFAPSPASAGGWKAAGASNGRGETLSYDHGEDRSWIFECAPDAVIITNVGITDLVDVRLKQKIGDAPGSTITPTASMMTLYTGKGDPEFQPAKASPNAVKGWDFTLRLAKDDKQLKALAKAEMMSLFTTGFTAAVTLEAPERKMFADFLARCRG
jgi:hypothetical protein